MIRGLVLAALLALSAPAQTFHVGGTYTDSSQTVTTPTAPAWATRANVELVYRSRYEWGRETDFVQYQGQCHCDFFFDGYVGQRAQVFTNGAAVAGGRTRLPFADYGPCVPFDGGYDWTGSSGNGGGLVYKTFTTNKVLSLLDLGPTITVDADGSSAYLFGITCTGTLPWDCLGQNTIYTSSWWEGQLTVTWLP